MNIPISKKSKYFLFILLAWLLFQGVQLNNEYNMMDGDDAQYVLHAQSMIQYRQYNHPNLIFRSGATTTPESTPPGWPVLLMPVVAVFGNQLIALKAVVILIALFSGIILYSIPGFFFPNGNTRLWITGAYYFSMTTIVYTRVIYSEWPYFLTSLAVIFLVMQSDSRSESKWRWLAVGVLTGAALLCRTGGIPLFLAVLTVLAQEAVFRRKPVRTVLIRTVIFLAGFLAMYEAVHIAVHPNMGLGYKSQFLFKDIDFQEQGQATFKDIVKRIPQNAEAFVRSLEPNLFGRSWHEFVLYLYPRHSNAVRLLMTALGLALLIFFMAGWIHGFRKGASVIDFYLLFYLLMMSVIWFHYETYRYLMPVSPFLLAYMVRGILSLFNHRKFSRDRLASVFLISVVCLNIAQAVMEIQRFRFSRQSAEKVFRPYHAAVDWLKNRVQTGEIVIADEPRWYALETGLKVTTFLKSRDADRVMDDLEQFYGSYVVLDPNRRFQKICLVPVIEKYGNRFQLLKEFDHIRIYRILDSSGEKTRLKNDVRKSFTRADNQTVQGTAVYLLPRKESL